MPEQQVLTRAELPAGEKKTITIGETKILVVHTEEGALHALEAECPHAKGPLEKGAVCNGRLVCPWHMGTFELATGAWVEPPPLRGLKVYRARWEADAVMVDAEPVNTPTLSTAGDDGRAPAACGTGKRVLAVGGGAATATAVCTLRQGGFAGTITVVDPVAGEPVDRTNLSKMTLAGQKPVEPLWPEDVVGGLQVERISGAVEQIEIGAGEAVTSKGQRIGFDYALLATGGVPKHLGISGEDLAHVHTIRHAADVDAIGATIGDRQPATVRAVVLGDSFIAFEAASALKTRGLQVTMVARDKEPFRERFGTDIASSILALHRRNRVSLRLGTEANGITEAVVTIEGGEALPAELVIVAVGVAPATGFKHGLALESEGSMATGRDLKVAGPVWVAGDIARVEGTRIEHWRLAEQHGRTAALAMLRAAGADVPEAEATYHGVPFFWTFHFGKRFGYLGHATEWDNVIVDGNLDESHFVAYFVKDDAVRAVMACGQDTALATLAERMREPLTLEAARVAVGPAT